MYDKIENFITEFEKEAIPLYRKSNLAYFNASISGKEEDYTEASELKKKLNKIYSSKEKFETLKEFKSIEISDPVIKRQIDLLYNDFASNQYDEELLEKIINLSTEIERKFSVFRAAIDSNELTDNQIDEILKTSKDSSELEKVWKASKVVGEKAEKDVIELVRLRNKAAAELGFENYYEMSLKLSEQDPEELIQLFDKLDELTKNEFLKLKEEMDKYLSNRFDISEEELMPWHYQDKFFQHSPQIYEMNLDQYFENQDLVELTKEYFHSLDLNIDDLIEKSDLFEKEGKYQHAYCVSIDKDTDVRVVCNIQPNNDWMSTMLHEFGHAVYDKYISSKLPWRLREPAHIYTTEAIAMLFGRFSTNPKWLFDSGLINDNNLKRLENISAESLKMQQIVFSRWVQVMFRFEGELYSNPEQDLNLLWWNLVEKYQLIKKPSGRNKPDWAAKIHIALYPAYYHNYMLGELLASQLYSYITRNVLNENPNSMNSFTGNVDVGNYLKYLFFSYGSLYPHQELIRKATGEELNPAYYAKQFVNSKNKRLV